MAKRADKRKFHYVYRIDRVDGKYYIGIHSTDDLDDDYFGSGTYLSNSLRYHGREKHSKTILEFYPTRKLASDREREMITDEMRGDPMCMNIAPGGGGGFISPEHAFKFQSAGGKATLGRKHKECSKKKIGDSQRGERHHSFSTEKINKRLEDIPGRSIDELKNLWGVSHVAVIKFKKKYFTHQNDSILSND